MTKYFITLWFAMALLFIYCLKTINKRHAVKVEQDIQLLDFTITTPCPLCSACIQDDIDFKEIDLQTL